MPASWLMKIPSGESSTRRRCRSYVSRTSPPDSLGRASGKSNRLDRVDSLNDEALLVQQGTVLGPELDLPIARASVLDAMPTIRTIAHYWIGSDLELSLLLQAVAVVPGMLDGDVVRRLQACVEDERSGAHGFARGIAAPVTGRAGRRAERRTLTELRICHRRRSRGSGWAGASRCFDLLGTGGVVYLRRQTRCFGGRLRRRRLCLPAGRSFWRLPL